MQTTGDTASQPWWRVAAEGTEQGTLTGAEAPTPQGRSDSSAATPRRPPRQINYAAPRVIDLGDAGIVFISSRAGSARDSAPLDPYRAAPMPTLREAPTGDIVVAFRFPHHLPIGSANEALSRLSSLVSTAEALMAMSIGSEELPSDTLRVREIRRGSLIIDLAPAPGWVAVPPLVFLGLVGAVGATVRLLRRVNQAMEEAEKMRNQREAARDGAVARDIARARRNLVRQELDAILMEDESSDPSGLSRRLEELERRSRRVVGVSGGIVVNTPPEPTLGALMEGMRELAPPFGVLEQHEQGDGVQT